MYLLYTGLLILALPFFVLRLYLRSFKERAYRQHMGERFVAYGQQQQVDVWVHAVSLGETLAITPLIKQILIQKPEVSIVFTNTTPSGRAAAEERFIDPRVSIVYFPYDVPMLIKRFLNVWQPRLVLFMETEVWPNTLLQCKAQGIQTMLVNARLSENSYRNYQKFSCCVPQLFQHVNYIAAQAEPDQKRFQKLGASNVDVLGNLKFDLELPENIQAQGAKWRTELDQSTLVLIFASTHPGEEAILLECFARLRHSYPLLKCVLVPRHPQRAEEILTLCQTNALSVILRSQVDVFPAATDCLLVDTMGELLQFYAMSDIVFVGGSLVPHGGHNLIEPCALAKSTLSGSYVKNFKDLQRMLLEQDAARYVHDVSELEQEIRALIEQPEERTALSQRAVALVEAQRGSLERQLKHIVSLI